jgi:hypothetical protein
LQYDSKRITITAKKDCKSTKIGSWRCIENAQHVVLLKVPFEGTGLFPVPLQSTFDDLNACTSTISILLLRIFPQRGSSVHMKKLYLKDYPARPVPCDWWVVLNGIRQKPPESGRLPHQTRQTRLTKLPLSKLHIFLLQLLITQPRLAFRHTWVIHTPAIAESPPTALPQH